MKVSGASLRATGARWARPGKGTGDFRAPGGDEAAALEDRKLIIEISRGDDRALACLYDRYAPVAYGLAVRVCGSRVLAEDVVQEAFLSIWRRVDSFDPDRGSVASYLLGAVRNKAVDAVRHERSVHRREQAFSDPHEIGIEQEPEEAAWLVWRRDQVRRAVTRLPHLQREAIELAYFGGLTYREVASRLDIPLGTAKTRLRDGMIRLRNLLSAPHVEGAP